MDLNFWKNLVDQDQKSWNSILQASKESETFILFCTSIGSHGPVVIHDSLLATALTLRGCRVETLLCDGILPACEACTCYGISSQDFLKEGPQGRYCRSCLSQGMEVFSGLNLPIHKYGDFVLEDDYTYAHSTVRNLSNDELKDFSLEGINLGEDAYAGTLRFFASGDIASELDGFNILRRYLRSAILTMTVSKRVFLKLKPTVLVFHHGIYVPQGILGQVARQQNIRIVNWSVGYRKQTFVYSHGDTYHRTMIDEPTDLWKARKLLPEEKVTLKNYLNSRRNSSQDWVKFNQNPEESVTLIRQILQLDDRPVILLLTNVTWDAQLYYKNNGFPSLLDWLYYTITYFQSRSDLQLVIRVHPGEIRGTMPTRQPVITEIFKKFQALPDNVHIVDPSSNISTYILAEMSDCAIIFGTKTGVELTARGIPVIVVGEAWIRNKGLTIDVSTEQEYLHWLKKLPLQQRMPDEQVELALQYAYHYFFRRLIPIQSLIYHEPHQQHELQQNSLVVRAFSFLKRKLYKLGVVKETDTTCTQIASHYSPDIRKIEELAIGQDNGLDIVCNAVQSGTQFIFDNLSI